MCMYIYVCMCVMYTTVFVCRVAGSSGGGGGGGGTGGCVLTCVVLFLLQLAPSHLTSSGNCLRPPPSLPPSPSIVAHFLSLPLLVFPLLPHSFSFLYSTISSHISFMFISSSSSILYYPTLSSLIFLLRYLLHSIYTFTPSLHHLHSTSPLPFPFCSSSRLHSFTSPTLLNSS